ncbi:MAG: hypothetical protein ACREEM_29965 [Blastocatellia bacterium]
MRRPIQVSKHRRPAPGPGLLVLLILSASCSGPAPPGRKQLGAAAPAGDARQNVSATTDDLVVYLDISEPMKGYVSAGGQSVFSRTLRVLREFTTTLSPPVEVRLRTVAAAVSPLKSDIELADAAFKPAVYNGRESNLAGAIDIFSQSLRPSSPEPNAVAPPRFHVLVTDGVQYSRSARPNDSCSSGTDAFCVRKKILALLDRQWAGVVIGIRSQYCCAFFSEKKQQWVNFKTDGLSQGQHRPFYLFIFSPDHTAVDGFVVRLKENLRKNIGEKNLTLRELPLTASYAEGPLGFDSASGFQPADKAKLQCSKISAAGANDPLLLSLKLREESRATEIPFKLNLTINWSAHGKDCGEAREMAGLLDWSLAKVYPAREQTGYRYPEISLGEAETDDQGNVSLPAVAKWPRAAGDAAWRGYRLIGRLKLDSEPAWISQWSTDLDNAPAAGSRTLDLKSSLLGLWRNPVLEKRPVAEAYLRIGPQ